ncbi:MAG: polysaccharide export protein [Legionella sp.]|nr:polysaccharide export protein [Legionella sp.]
MPCFWIIILVVFSSILSGCATYPSWLSSAGPSADQVKKAPKQGIPIIQINSQVAQRLLMARRKRLFSETFSAKNQEEIRVGTGDVLEVSMWEAPPAMLFNGSLVSNPRAGGAATTQITNFPAQMVNSKGYIHIPFAGEIVAAGRTLSQIESSIVSTLKDIAHQPQALVRLITNNSSDVTVVGEVSSSRRVALTPHRERLLDALADSGGVRQEVSKVTLQLTRGEQVNAMPLAHIIRDPKQNIVLRAGDVITALYQPFSFTVLGATGRNEEITFEAQGISLSQALARAGGLQDNRADARAVFVFRFEDKEALGDPCIIQPWSKSSLVPVIYQLNLLDPASFFSSQQFRINNKDVLYVSNAPAADLQKFLNIVVSAVYPIVNAGAIAWDRW